MTTYLVTVGLEVHAELSTKSKMWCGCANNPKEERPNALTCEVCMAHPGTLPVPNKEALEKVIRVGCAVNGTIADFTEFDRKNYFYPDIPKGYQLSQYKYPVVSGGILCDIPLTRIHLEEDTARSSHVGGTTLVDFNRAGVPLMELVTEPVLYESKEEAAEKSGAFAKELQRILRYVDASEANMELGQMRVEANISVSKDRDVRGTKCEVKNLNSFASVESAIMYEVDRHIELLENNKTVTQETRGWDEAKRETFSQRKKENAHDYRYFPDPDLPKLYLHSLFDIENIRTHLPELPEERRARYTSLSLTADYVNILVDSPVLSAYVDKVSEGKDSSFLVAVANYVLSDTLGILKKENKEVRTATLPHTTTLRELIEHVQSGALSSRGAKDLLPHIMDAKEVSVEALAREKNLLQSSDKESLRTIVQDVLKENQSQVADYKNGKESMFMFFVGQAMKKSKGSGNPGLFQELLKEELR